MTSAIPLPHDELAEQAIIGSCLIDPKIIERVASFLIPRHFSSEANRRMYEGILWLYERGSEIDAVTLGAHLGKSGRLVQVGGMSAITDTMSVVHRLHAVEDIAKHIYELWRLGTFIAQCQRAAVEGYMPIEDVGVFIAKHAEASAAIAEQSLSKEQEKNAIVLARIIRKMHADIAASAKDGAATGISGVPTGIGSYDAMTAGLHSKELTVMAARPGMGKSAFALQTAHSCLKNGIGVIFFTFEMSKDDLLMRLISQRSGIDSQKFRGGGEHPMSPLDWQKLTEAATFIGKSSLIINDDCSLNARGIAAFTKECIDKRKPSDPPIGLIVVDYIQFVAPNPGLEKSFPRDQIAATSRCLRTLAKDTGLPVFVLAALNRDVEKNGAVRHPRMSDIRDCGAIESDADNIVFLHRTGKVGKDGAETYEPSSCVELIIAKQRGGRGNGVCRLTFDGPTTTFYEAR